MRTHLLACNLSILDDRWGRGVDPQHGVVVVWIMLRVGFIRGHNRWRGDNTTLDTEPLPWKSLKENRVKAGWLLARFLLSHRQSNCYNTGRKALGTLNILNSKWTVALNFIRKIPFHFNISWNCQNKWSGFHGHRAAQLVLPLFQHLAALVGAQAAWDITFCSGCPSEWFQSHHGREHWATEKVNVRAWVMSVSERWGVSQSWHLEIQRHPRGLENIGKFKTYILLSVSLPLAVCLIVVHPNVQLKTNNIEGTRLFTFFPSYRGRKMISIYQSTLVVVLAPHEDAAPVGQVVWDNGQSVSPGFHHCLHVVEAGVAAQIGWLEPCIDLGCFLQLNDLLCCLVNT